MKKNYLADETVVDRPPDVQDGWVVHGVEDALKRFLVVILLFKSSVGTREKRIEGLTRTIEVVLLMGARTSGATGAGGVSFFLRIF